MIRLFVIVALAAFLSACASGQQPGSASSMNIELLGFPGCPNTPALRDNLRRALESLGSGLTFRDVDQGALPETDLRRGWPTPTVLVDGRDLFGMAPPASPSMGCRVYPEGVPDPASIAERLRTWR